MSGGGEGGRPRPPPPPPPPSGAAAGAGAAAEPAGECDYDCLVVGAGLAGLTAARALREQRRPGDRPWRVAVVEARAAAGGRVQHVEGLAPWPVQLGAEFIHGEDGSLLVDLLRGRLGWQLRRRAWPDRYWWGGPGARREMVGPAGDAAINQVHEWFEGLREEAGPDMQCDDWLRAKGADADQLEVADVCYANDFGCSLHHLGVREMQEEQRHWTYGDLYLLADRSLAEAVAALAEGTEVRLNWPVRRVDYSAALRGAGPVVVTGGPGGAAETLRCRRLIVTVPVSILQAGDIAFAPPLPLRKRSALGRIRMSTASKVILSFRRPFWPNDFFDACCMHAFLPELWVTTYPATAAKAEGTAEVEGQAVVVGFVAGERAVALEALAGAEVIARALHQLDAMFGSATDPAPASAPASFVTGLVHHWRAEPFIRGAYSVPGAGVLPGDREALGAPVGDPPVLFFAGEATHAGVNPCMQAALETGALAAARVCFAEKLAQDGGSKL